MRMIHLLVVASFVVPAVVLWFVGPTRNPFALAFLAVAFAVGTLAIATPLLLKARIVSPGSTWGDGSLDRPLQGLGVALLSLGTVAGSRAASIIGAVCLAAGCVIEIVRNRRRRLT